jgi:DNA-binding CsgD family transcriptional regulator
MADVISPTDRALIEAALAEGRVTRVLRGVSGLPGYVCDSQTGKLICERPQHWRDQLAAAARTHARARRLQRAAAAPVKGAASPAEPKLETKAARIKAALLRGEAPGVVAEATGSTAAYVYNVATRLRKAGHAMPPRADFSAQRARVLELHAEGLSFGEIAQRMDMTRHQVAGLVARARARSKREAAHG